MDLLTTAMWRGIAVLSTDLPAAYGSASTPAQALTMLVGSYVDFTQIDHDLVGLMITEVDQVAEDDRLAARQAQRDYVGEWIHLLGMRDPKLDRTEAAIRVHAALGIANDMARIPRLRGCQHLRPALAGICERVLGLQGATD